MTVMTLMTLIYGLILKRGASPLPRPLPLQPNPTNPTLGAENPIPMLFSSLQSVSGFLRLADNPTTPPDEKDGPSSGLSRASSGQQLEPDDNKPLTYAGYPGLVGLSGLVRRYERGYLRESGRRRIGRDTLYILKADCEAVS